MSKQIFISGLTLLSVLFATATSGSAELAPGVNTLTIKRIEESKTPSRTNNRQFANASERSMAYVRQGLAAQRAGNDRLALEYYYRAVKLDRTNAVAFMAAGNLLGDTDEGISCMKAAALLFQRQENQEGYEMATNWLAERGASE
ncbi:tetratricopeptide repeat protein [Chamaesiphon minutus]|uniref:Tetratricopeptide repeat protein n=1 Tax=Chamaesiphon minutus (strain ATCC 27169 / PCC 6605) TaxID=1173020 RepID=K9UC63_CHAP6|nr:tetratricopeptide repeat protein [Chamaesiphon minutus]AFY91779.1 tetratricopeptide repeat protein [Chamaesiphon minutus PCC 6605]